MPEVLCNQQQTSNVNCKVLGMQGEAADDDGEEEAGPEKKVSKLVSFTWALKLSGASSPGASALQPGLLESLTGTFAGMLAGKPAAAGFLQSHDAGFQHSQ